MAKKCSGVFLSMTAPLMYSVTPKLPYVISGLLCGLYTALFIVVTQRQQRENVKLIAELIAVANEGIDEEEARELVQKFCRMTAASSECTARMAECAMNVYKLDLAKTRSSASAEGQA